MVACTYCGREIPIDGVFCPYCGRERRYLTTNYDLPPALSNEIYKTGGAISSYITSGTILVTEAQSHPESPLLDFGAKDYQIYSPTIPAKLTERTRGGEDAIRNLEKELRRRERANEIVNLMCNSNVLFFSRKHAKLFREDTPQIFPELYSPCQNNHDLVTKIASICSLFEVNLTPLRGLITEAPEDFASIRLVELWLTSAGIPFEPDMVNIWKNIRTLRNIPPLHSGSHAQELTSALSFFGETFPINYERLWDTVLDKFRFSLEEWQRILSNVPA